MALFNDKKKPVDIYAQGTPTVAAQDKTTAIATSPIRAALNKGALAPAKALFDNVVAPAANAATKPLVDARKANQAYVDNQSSQVIGRAANREADALLYGNSERRVGGNAPINPVRQALVGNSSSMMRDGIQSQRIDPATAESLKRATANTAADAMAYNSANPDIQQPAQRMREVITNKGNQMMRTQQPILGQPEQAASNVRRVLSNRQSAGNLDITFDKGTDQGSIRRFMENPVRPTTQIDRYNAQQGRVGPSQGQIAAMNAGQVLRGAGQQQGGTQMLTRQNSPGMGWHQRTRLNEQILANQQSGKNAELQANTMFSTNAADNSTRMATARMGETTAREKNDIDRENMRGSLGIQKGTLDVNRMNVEGQNTERAANVKAKDMEIGQSKRLLDLQDAYRKEVDPTKKKALENELYAMQGKPQQKGQVVTRKTVDSQGNQIEIPYVLDSEFNAREIGSDQQAQAAPKDPKQRVKGATYLDASGNKIIWDGTGFIRG